MICNHKENPVITLGYPGRSDRIGAVCRTAKRTFSPEQAEQAAVLLLAETAFLTLDRHIFRRNMPADLRNGLVLVLHGEAVSPLGSRYREFHFRLTGRDENPDQLHQRISAIRTGLPREIFVQVQSRRLPEPVHFVHWEINKIAFDEGVVSGAKIATATMELAVQVCFAP